MMALLVRILFFGIGIYLETLRFIKLAHEKMVIENITFINYLMFLFFGIVAFAIIIGLMIGTDRTKRMKQIDKIFIFFIAIFGFILGLTFITTGKINTIVRIFDVANDLIAIALLIITYSRNDKEIFKQK